MRNSFLLFILLMTPQTPVKPAQSPKTIIDGAALDIRKTSSTLNLGSIGGCAVDGFLVEKESHACGFWGVDSVFPPTKGGSVLVFQVIDSEVVSRWMKTEATRLSPGSTAITDYLGVPAYVSTSQSPLGAEIRFGKDKFIVVVSGISKDEVDLVARAVLRQISN